ncbi:MAG: LamG domain-containing protein [Phycisphaerales bacterium]
MAASPSLAVDSLEYSGATAPCPAEADSVSATQHFRHGLLSVLPALLLAANAFGDVNHRFASIPIEYLVAIDIDEDGTTDYDAPVVQGGWDLALEGATWMHTFRAPFAQRGRSIGPTQADEYDSSSLVIYSFAKHGQYAIPDGEHMIGITFPRNGALHYGWLGVSVALGDGGLTATVTDIAWETTPFKPILAGWADCNGDGIGDVQQIAAGLLADCNGDFIADLCQPDEDCNANGVRDLCEFASGAALDCNGNLVPDACEIAADPSIDCNGDGKIDACAGSLGDADGNGVMDVCEGLTAAEDCNGNGIADWIEILYGVTVDWTFNGVPDECDFAANPALDCDGNGIADAFNLEFQPWLDCNGDGVIDSCQGLAPELDCNGNGIADACEPPGPASADCDGNGRFDVCDIADGLVADCNGNGIPDTCEDAIFATDNPACLALSAAGAAAVVPGMGLALPTDEITIEFWQWVDVDQNQTTFRIGLDPTNGCFAMVPALGGDIYWSFGNTGLWCIPQQPLVGAWHHFAFQASQSASFMRIYVDGALASSQGWMDPREPSDQPLVLGGTSWHAFTGRIDEFRIWDSARSAAQIAENMLGPVDASTPGLVGYWRFDEGTGAVAVDLVAGRNAQLVEGATWGVPALCAPSPDLDGDGDVDGGDMGILLGAWGVAPRGTAADLDSNGMVDAADLGLLLAAWGNIG